MKKLSIICVLTLALVFVINPAFSQDIDSDGIIDAEDNCPNTYNPSQENYDEDEVGNVCDNCWYVSNPSQEDTFGIDCSEIIMPYTEDPSCGDVCDCMQEGETFLVGSGFNCCSGLGMSLCCSPSEPIGAPDSCSCRFSCRTCIKCGDGICGNGENWCTCIEDCPRPEEIPCTENSQCGQDGCQQGASICHELRFNCIEGECSFSDTAYVNKSCNRYYGDPSYPEDQCVDSCGDGICHWPEVRSWCPEDCDCEDIDSDYICNWKDNCPETPNSFAAGTCSKGTNAGSPCTVAGENETACGTGGFCSMDQEDADNDLIGDVCDICTDYDRDDYGGDPEFPLNTCYGEDNCPNDYNPDQLDTYPPGGNEIGDACECEGDFDCSGGVDAADVTTFLTDFGRSPFSNPCTDVPKCKGDFNCDLNVDAADVTVFLEDFGRSEFFNPCPACEVGDWCVY